MANHKQAIKRHRQSVKRRNRNRAITTRLRGLIKTARASIATGKPDEALVKAATRALDRAASQGIMHKRTASRRVGRMVQAFKRAQQG